MKNTESFDGVVQQITLRYDADTVAFGGGSDMNLVNHNAEGATIHLDPRELLMVMALVQEGRDAFDCEGKTGSELDQLFCSAVVGVQEARLNREAMLVEQPEMIA